MYIHWTFDFHTVIRKHSADEYTKQAGFIPVIWYGCGIVLADLQIYSGKKYLHHE